MARETNADSLVMGAKPSTSLAGQCSVRGRLSPGYEGALPDADGSRVSFCRPPPSPGMCPQAAR